MGWVRLRFTQPAALDLDQILTFIQAHSPTGARNVKGRIQMILDLLLLHPEAGQSTRRAGMRRIVASPYPYPVFYKIVGDEIVIHAVRRGARKPRF